MASHQFYEGGSGTQVECSLVMGDTDTKVSILPIPVSVLLVSIIRCCTAAKRYDTLYVMYLEHVVLTLQ